jgi:hypothetical protein
MSGRQITVTDGETGHKGEIKSVNDTPSLYVPDQKSGSDHCKKNPGEDRPERANKPKELCEEDAPDLPWSHWSPTRSRPLYLYSAVQKIPSRRRRPWTDCAAYAFSTNLRLRTRIRLEWPPQRREHWRCIVDPCLRFRIGFTQRNCLFAATHATAHKGAEPSSEAISYSVKSVISA